jgi:Kdo2-lipid IVA lauroyltransferase/acyltransferase
MTARRASIWLRLVGRLPEPLLYAFASFLTFLAFRVVHYRDAVIRENLSFAFPDLDEPARRALIRRFYAGYADVLVELVMASCLDAESIRGRVTIRNLERVRERIAAGKPVLLMGAHQCNWEWMLLALSLELGYPLDAAYKPLVDPWADREMLLLRTRFGARLVPAPELFGDVLRRNKILRAIAMVGDQEPVTSDKKHWVRFLNRDSAFFLGGEEIVRKFKYAAFFIRMKRTARGQYEMDFEPLCEAGEALVPGEFTERYARLVEAQIHSAPADWPWNHKRWRLRKPLYGA